MNKRHEFVRYGEITLRKKHRLLDLKLSEKVQVRPLGIGNWYPGVVCNYDGGQIYVNYNRGGSVLHYWTHTDCVKEIRLIDENRDENNDIGYVNEVNNFNKQFKYEDNFVRNNKSVWVENNNNPWIINNNNNGIQQSFQIHGNNNNNNNINVNNIIVNMIDENVNIIINSE